MKSLIVSKPQQLKAQAAITLPASKSICNRALILQKILGSRCTVTNSSEADDSVIMQQALLQTSGTVDVKNAGTCMRFLTAYYACTSGIDVVLHGDERMHKRPIGVLVEALKKLGADIDYINEPGFAPLRIKGRTLNGGVIEIDASVSSQFTSALMLVAPTFKNGLVITQGSMVVSRPYIYMTAALMKQCGMAVNLKHDIVVRPLEKSIPEVVINVEPDWSAASYWFEMVALAGNTPIKLDDLTQNSIQGDASLVALMRLFGVETHWNGQGAVISFNKNVYETSIAKGALVFDMNDFPDLVPAMAVLACGLNIACRFIKVSHLEAKESKRLTALSAELQKCGFDCSHNSNELIVKPVDFAGIKAPEQGFETYNDHRMAMAFAPLALIFGQVKINNPDVVEKSYPGFWYDLEKAGFIFNKIE